MQRKEVGVALRVRQQLAWAYNNENTQPIAWLSGYWLLLLALP
jgi:hypothetical protein